MTRGAIEIAHGCFAVAENKVPGTETAVLFTAPVKSAAAAPQQRPVIVPTVSRRRKYQFVPEFHPVAVIGGGIFPGSDRGTRIIGDNTFPLGFRGHPVAFRTGVAGRFDPVGPVSVGGVGCIPACDGFLPRLRCLRARWTCRCHCPDSPLPVTTVYFPARGKWVGFRIGCTQIVAHKDFPLAGSHISSAVPVIRR